MLKISSSETERLKLAGNIEIFLKSVSIIESLAFSPLFLNKSFIVIWTSKTSSTKELLRLACGSMSTSRTEFFSAITPARLNVIVDFPVPPLSADIAILFISFYSKNSDNS